MVGDVVSVLHVTPFFHLERWRRTNRVDTF